LRMIPMTARAWSWKEMVYSAYEKRILSSNH
jgi:hypothetical protein